MLREVIGCYFFFLGNEATKSVASNVLHLDDRGPWVTAFAGGIAGVSYWASIFPLDTVKSKIQVSDNAKSEGVVNTALSILRRGGVRAFYSGVAPCLVRAFPSGAVMFLAYEYSKRFLLHSLS